jgi:hypothetical protein
VSDMNMGPGWWQASDGKWYPPHTAPVGSGPSDPRPGFFGTHKVLKIGGILLAIFVLLGIIGAATGSGTRPTKLAASETPATTAPPATAPPTTAPPTTEPPTVPPTTEPPTVPPTTAPPVTAPPVTTPSLTLSQQNAIEAAQQYLSMGNGFSRLGLTVLTRTGTHKRCSRPRDTSV